MINPNLTGRARLLAGIHAVLNRRYQRAFAERRASIGLPLSQSKTMRVA